MPFRNYSLTKGGQLTIGQIMSPDFVHGVSGWRIGKDGSAEFQNVILPGSAKGVTATFSATAPPGPNTDDLWYDTANGLLLSQWDGTEWVPYQIGTGAIADQAITGSLIEAGTVLRSTALPSTALTGQKILTVLFCILVLLLLAT
jgi:hypothetical protein